jgi:hypothetical protein
MFSAALLATAAALADDDGHINGRNSIQRVLVDQHRRNARARLSELRQRRLLSTLAKLGKTGVNYTRTTPSRSSDSFLGLMALVIGRTPKTVGAFYDVDDRVLAPPFNDTGNGNFSGACKPNQANGTTTEYEEGVEFNQTLLNGGAPGASLTGGGVKAIDATRLPRDPFTPDPNNGGCAPVYPWNFIARTLSTVGSRGARLHGLVGQARCVCGGIGSHRQQARAALTITIRRRSTPTPSFCRELRPKTGSTALSAATLPTTMAATGPPASKTSAATISSRSTQFSMKSPVRRISVTPKRRCPTFSG